MKLPKKIQEIYEEVKEFDIVLTSDVVLASALNRQIKTARIGRLAYTPKELAQKHSIHTLQAKVMKKVEIILCISKQLQKDIKIVHNAIENIIQIERFTDDVTNYLSNNEKEIYNAYKDFPTEHKSISNFNKENLPEKVAVIDSRFFNNIDKKVLPEEYTEIKFLTEDDKTFSNFFLFNSQENLVNTLISLINKDNQSDIAIILDTKNSLLNLIKSKLYEKELDIHIKDFLHEDLKTRTFIDLLQTAFYIEEATVKEINPFLESFNIQIPYMYDNYLFSKYVLEISDNEKLKKVFNFLLNITDKTYKEYYALFGELPEQLNEPIKKLGLSEKKINYDNFSDLKYFINNFDIEITNTKKGVLLADCKSSVAVDRPICIYLNPDISWTKQVQNAEYIDKKLEEQNNLDKFQIILTQGDEQLYFAQIIKDNEKNTPCFYFNQIEKREIKDFHDELFNAQMYSSAVLENRNEKIIVNDKVFSLDLFSQSSLNTFFACPKKFELSRINPVAEQTYFLKGNLLHYFAEFYVNHKDLCNEKGDDFFTELLLKKYMQMIPKANEDIEKTLLKIGIKNIKSFIDAQEINQEHNLVNIQSQRANENIIAKALEKELNNKNTELSFENRETKLKGFIDLVINSGSIVDYKSSKIMKTRGKIISKSNLNLIKDEADFQPLVYLLELAKHNPDKELSFYYYFFMNNYGDVINQVDDMESNIVEIEYYPTTFNDFIISDKGLEIICEKGPRKDIIDILGKETIIQALKENPVTPIKENLMESKSHEILLEKIIAIKDTKKNRNMVDDFFKEIYRLKAGSSLYPKALFFKEDLEEFEQFLKEQFNRVNIYAKEGFPRKPKSKEVCKNCDFKDMCFGWCE